LKDYPEDFCVYRIEEFEAVFVFCIRVAVDLPSEGQRYIQDSVHVIGARAVGYVANCLASRSERAAPLQVFGL